MPFRRKAGRTVAPLTARCGQSTPPSHRRRTQPAAHRPSAPSGPADARCRTRRLPCGPGGRQFEVSANRRRVEPIVDVLLPEPDPVCEKGEVTLTGLDAGSRPALCSQVRIVRGVTLRSSQQINLLRLSPVRPASVPGLACTSRPHERTALCDRPKPWQGSDRGPTQGCRGLRRVGPIWSEVATG